MTKLGTIELAGFNLAGQDPIGCKFALMLADAPMPIRYRGDYSEVVL